MQSFRTELENPVVERDILDLERKIYQYRQGKIPDEKFRSLRLVRGIYGQRQPGVQMIRIKIPYGKLSTAQLIRIADLSEEYGSGVLHATTRQDIQIHYVSLEHTPALWAKLEEENITLREACGNTVRNITAAPTAGIDPAEPFDVSPYAQAMFAYFLRNPVCQEMGRKFKIAFSAHEHDTAFTFIHDLGFLPKVRHNAQGQVLRGFKVLVGGGLGAQPHLAQVSHEFLHEDQLIPFTEAVLRVFDRYGERTRRHKARLKFLIQDIGLEQLLTLVAAEQKALKHQRYTIDTHEINPPTPQIQGKQYPTAGRYNAQKYQHWYNTNVFAQRQEGFYGVWVKVPLGNLTAAQARRLAAIVREYAADELRVTANQGYLLKFVRPEALTALFEALDAEGFAEPGFDSTGDITACPGTDTCNLGISSSTGVSLALEKVIREEYPDLVYNHDIKIKISGCPNSCGQHGLASIGFHGSSLKSGKEVLPALQVLLGGGVLGNGEGRIADKVIKIPSKRAPQALRLILNDYEERQLDGEYFTEYYQRLGEMHFYHLLKPLADLSNLEADDFLDWGNEGLFEVEKAVGECAGVIIDLVATLFLEAEEKLTFAQENYLLGHFADAIYQAYAAFIHTAKALLLTENIQTNSQISVLREFDKQWTDPAVFGLAEKLEHWVLRINQHTPTGDFAQQYLADSAHFLEQARDWRAQ